MLKVATALPNEPYREYKDVERVYSGSTEIDKILDKNGNVLFAVNKEVEGTPALTYKGKEETNLKNYRIYGQTVDGESVGDRTGNLFDKSQFIQSNLVLRANSTYIMGDPYTISTILPCKPNTKYTITKIITNRFIIWGCENYPVAGGNGNGDIVRDDNATSLTFTTGSNDNFLLVMLFYQRQPNDQAVEDVKNNLMYNYGEMCPYEPYGYKVPVTVTNGADTQTTNLYLPEQIKMVGDEAEYVDYGEQKQHRVRKNLLPNTATSQTINGVTFTVNSDGSIVCDGQASPSNADLIYSDFLVPSGTYILTGCPNGGSERETYKMLLFINGAWRTNDKGSGTNFTLTELSTVSVRIAVYNGYTCDNLTFYPMICKAAIEDDTYEPYIENTDLDVTLPALPTLTGTNTLTVGTEVQPSNVYLNGRIKEIT